MFIIKAAKPMLIDMECHNVIFNSLFAYLLKIYSFAAKWMFINSVEKMPYIIFLKMNPELRTEV